jgi:hypothetical protein
MKKMIIALLCASCFQAFGLYSGGGGVTAAQLATKADITYVDASVAAEAALRTANDDDLRNAISSGQALQYSFYLATNMYNAGDFSYTPTNNQRLFCGAQTTNVTSFTYTYTATNTYGFVAFCTNNTFYTNAAGTAYFYDYASENGSGDITEKVELYAFVKGTTNGVEIGDVAVPLQVTAGSTPVMRIFNIPYQAYANTNGYYFGIKKKCTAKGTGTNVTQWTGNGYNTHLDLALPSAILADFYVAKTQIAQSLASNSTSEVPSVAAVALAISNATPSVSLQNVLNTGSAATNANMALGTTNTTLGKVAIVGEAGAYTNKPMLYIERSATGTTNFISCAITGTNVFSVNVDGSVSRLAVNNGTNYVYTEYWDATNNVKRFTRNP